MPSESNTTPCSGLRIISAGVAVHVSGNSNVDPLFY
jgi:hypothetical protein